ncbi:DUF2500 domain-containing protein [Vibrio cholerae]
MPITLFVAIVLFVLISGALFVRFYRQHMQGEGSQEQSAQVTILDKQSVPVEHAAPGEDDLEYWIYVQKGRLGPKREFQVGVHYYHALTPGDKGTLIYQGDTFLHFARQR